MCLDIDEKKIEFIQHDIDLMGWLTLLTGSNMVDIPSYGSVLLIELYKNNDGNYTIEVWFRDCGCVNVVGISTRLA
jgi:hypothetical protein